LLNKVYNYQMRENPNGLAGLYDEFRRKYGLAPAKVPKKDPFLDDAEIQGAVLPRMRDFVDAYDLIQKNDPRNERSEDEEGVRQTQLLQNISLKGGAATLEVRKIFKDFTKAPWLNHEIGDQVERVALNLSSEGKRIGSVILEKKGETGWTIDHRETDEAHRGEGIFKGLLKIAEAFVREYGEKSRKPQSISIDLAQPDLLRILQNMDYKPATDTDAEKISRVIAGDEGLEIDYAVTSRGDLQADKNPYIFERARFRDGKEKKQPMNAFRMVLAKPLGNETAVDDLVQRLRKERDKI